MSERRSLVNLDPNVDFTKEPVFFGKPLNLERYDKFRYVGYFELFKKQLNWKPWIEKYGNPGLSTNVFEIFSPCLILPNSNTLLSNTAFGAFAFS